jgi:cytochrome P450
MHSRASIDAVPVASLPRTPGLPLIGSLLDFRRDQLGLQLRGVGQGELVRVPIGLYTMLMGSTPRIAHEVFVEKADAFRKLSVFARPLLGDGLINSERQVHRRRRRMMAPVFAAKRIASYADVMIAKTEAAGDRLARRSTADLVDEMMQLTLEIVGKTLFDVEMGQSATPIGETLTVVQRRLLDAAVRLIPLPPNVPTLTNLRLRAAVRRLDAIVYAMIRERRAEGVDHGDMLGMLLATRDADDQSLLTDLEVRDEAIGLLLAGHETTANALSWTFYLLARNPAVRSRMEGELDAVLSGRRVTAADLPLLPYTLAVFKEAMRLYPPVYFVVRIAARDVVIGGVQVRRKQLLLVNVAGIQRREDIFPDPDRFDPERFLQEREKALPPLAYLPFGAGPRVCIGAHFALMEAHLVLATLARRYRFDLMPSAPIEAEPLITLRPKGGVPVRILSRSASGP